MFYVIPHTVTYYLLPYEKFYQLNTRITISYYYMYVKKTPVINNVQFTRYNNE